MNASALDLARQRFAVGDLDGAERECAAVLATAASPADAAQAHLIAGACRQRQRDFAAARAHVRDAQTLEPANAMAWYAAAEIEDAAGNRSAAIAALHGAIRRAPSLARAHHLLGILLAESGDYESALREFETTVKLESGHARGFNNLGNALRHLGRIEDANRAFERSVALDPGYALAVANFASSLRDMGRAQDAEAALRAYLARYSDRPPSRPVYALLASLASDRGMLEEAAQYFARAIEAACGESAAEWVQLAWIRTELGDIEAARDAYAKADVAVRGDLRGTIGRRLALPLVYRSRRELDLTRERYARGVAELERDATQFVSGRNADEVLDGLRWSNFFLAYQGCDDLALQTRYAGFAAKAIDAVAPGWRKPLTPRAQRRPRLRVGFASSFFREGTVGRYFERWVTDLDAQRFEVFVYHVFPGADAVSSAIARRAAVFRRFGGSRARPSLIAPAIRDDELDVLVYPELGMDATCFALAALRLAPRQYAAWGHPVTTGQATIDGFFTAASMEPDGAGAHYAEALVPLPGIGTCYSAPAVPDRGERALFGLPEDVPLVLCPQSLFKIHPDNDLVFARVLAANPRAQLVLFGWRSKPVTAQSVGRIRAALADTGVAPERLHVLDALPHADFLRVNLSCDAMLDTLHWSGGNTALDALACGLPIVTLPGAFMRGRQSMAMLRMMGQEALIARDVDHYIDIATRLLQDPEWRDARRREILAAKERVFGDSAPLERFAEFLLESR